MGAIPLSAFERRLAALDPEERARFVAAVYAVGGSDATARADRVRIVGGASVGSVDDRSSGAVADGRGEDASTLWIARTGWLGRPRSVPPGVDGVVVAGSGLAAGDVDDGTRPIVDAGRLREFALYGIDREAVRPAFRRHLGCEPDGWDAQPAAPGGAVEPAPGLLERTVDLVLPGGGTDGGRGGGSDGRPTVARSRTAVAVVAIVALAVGLAFVPGLGPLAAGAAGPAGDTTALGGDGSGAVGASTQGASGERSAPTGALGSAGDPDGGRTADGRTLAIDGDGDDPTLAPGVTADGIASAETLADAHRAAVANRSYVWTATYMEYEDGVRITQRRALVRRANATHYSADGGGWGEARGVPVPVAAGDLYADGTVEFERTGTGEYVTRPVTAPEAKGDRLAGQVGRMIEWYLSANSSSVVGPVQEIGVGDGVEEAFDDRLYRVQTTGDPYWGITNASTLAVVADEGVVVALYHSHELPGENVTVVVTFGYDFDESVDVWKPYWIDDSDADADDGAVERGAPGGNVTGEGGEADAQPAGDAADERDRRETADDDERDRDETADDDERDRRETAADDEAVGGAGSDDGDGNER